MRMKSLNIVRMIEKNDVISLHQTSGRIITTSMLIKHSIIEFQF